MKLREAVSRIIAGLLAALILTVFYANLTGEGVASTDSSNG